MVTSFSGATTALFVPGDRPDRLPKALASGADIVIVDLEDAVAEPNRPAAREHVARVLRGVGDRFAVRVNATASAEHAADLTLLAEIGSLSRLCGVLLPKVESAEEIGTVRAVLRPDVEVVALVESARGMVGAREIAAAPGLARLALGAIDLAADIDAASPDATDMARFELVIASRSAALPAPLDTPSAEFRDMTVVEEAARRGRSLGMGGTLCIHPAQLKAVREAFAPSPGEVAWAERVLDRAAGGAFQLDGTMVDRPVVLRAERILARSGGRS
jgi:citrate lyase subunit beta/citryl-CoA lyase